MPTSNTELSNIANIIIMKSCILDPLFRSSTSIYVYQLSWRMSTCHWNPVISCLLWKLPFYLHYLRWLDWIFWGWYLPTLSINYVGMNKDMEKRGRHGNGITRLRFSFIFVFLCSRSFLKKSLKGVCTCYNCLHYGVVWTNSMRAFSKYFEM